MRAGNDAAPRPGTEGTVSVAGGNIADDTKHGALNAADARPWWVDLAWMLGIRNCASEGGEFSADDVQRIYDLPDAGNAVGGFFMRAHRAGIIRRIGYRASSRPSRSGGVVAVWVGVR